MSRNTKTIMFFDGGCPMCKREVAHYRSLDRQNRVSWVDISRDADALAAYDVGLDAAMKRLHAVDDQGRVVSGVPAFVTVWRQLPIYRHLAWIVESTRTVPFLDRVYARFAAWRFRRRCGSKACPSNP